MTAILIAEVFPAARADPVTPADLAGKTICWESASFGPSKSFFGEGGEYSSTALRAAGFGKGTWAVTSAGVYLWINRAKTATPLAFAPASRGVIRCLGVVQFSL